jgi:hypothetical protein
VGRAAKKPETGTSARLAAGRRGRGADKPAGRGADKRGASASRPRGGRGAGRDKETRASLPARLLKFVLLLAFMAVLGFSVVLVVDVGLTLVGGMRFGQITFAELFDKVGDRLFDRDLPAPKPRATRKAPTTTPAPAPAPVADRAPATAPRPDEYGQRLQHRPDPEIEAARDRLDDLLRKL